MKNIPHIPQNSGLRPRTPYHHRQTATTLSAILAAGFLTSVALIIGGLIYTQPWIKRGDDQIKLGDDPAQTTFVPINTAAASLPVPPNPIFAYERFERIISSDPLETATLTGSTYDLLVLNEDTPPAYRAGSLTTMTTGAFQEITTPSHAVPNVISTSARTQTAHTAAKTLRTTPLVLTRELRPTTHTGDLAFGPPTP